jgi:hypothetical protein
VRFRPLRRHAPSNEEPPAPPEGDAPDTGPAQGAPPAGPGQPERMLAVEWAHKHQVNAVMAERAAMYAGKRNEPVTEQEFLEMLRRNDV